MSYDQWQSWCLRIAHAQKHVRTYTPQPELPNITGHVWAVHKEFKVPTRTAGLNRAIAYLLGMLIVGMQTGPCLRKRRSGNPCVNQVQTLRSFSTLGHCWLGLDDWIQRDECARWLRSGHRICQNHTYSILVCGGKGPSNKVRLL